MSRGSCPTVGCAGTLPQSLRYKYCFACSDRRRIAKQARFEARLKADIARLAERA